MSIWIHKSLQACEEQRSFMRNKPCGGFNLKAKVSAEAEMIAAPASRTAVPPFCCG
jgi:hypothetical protein